MADSPSGKPKTVGGVGGLALGMGAAAVLIAAIPLLSLRSQAGNTVAEAFYQRSGAIAIGLTLMLAGIYHALRQLRRFDGTVTTCYKCAQRISISAELCPYCQTPKPERLDQAP